MKARSVKLTGREVLIVQEALDRLESDPSDDPMPGGVLEFDEIDNLRRKLGLGVPAPFPAVRNRVRQR
jgi:hypothetical protein